MLKHDTSECISNVSVYYFEWPQFIISVFVEISIFLEYVGRTFKMLT